MKRVAALGLALGLWAAIALPAWATALLNTPVATAVSAQLSPTFQLQPQAGPVLPSAVVLQGTFTYGSGGTSADAYVQTSLDGGTTWIDVADFHFTTASARFAYNLNSSTSVTTEYTPSDGSLSANTAKDGIVGPLWRVKYTTVGTYAASTKLRVDMFANGLTASSP
jgi:hypothetical protein